jgi:hypothetical protein
MKKHVEYGAKILGDLMLLKNTFLTKLKTAPLMGSSQSFLIFDLI